MRKHFLLLVYVFLVTNLIGQIPPLILSTDVYPGSPSENDSVFLVGEILTTNTPSQFFGHEIIDLGDTIVISACYGDGVSNATDMRKDTFNLGVKSTGHYEILYNVHFSYWPNADSCNYNDSNFVYIPFDVGYASIIGSRPAGITIYPNPVLFGIINVFVNEESELVIVNELGQIVLITSVVGEQQIDVSSLSGIYFVRILNQSFTQSEKILISR